MRLIDTHCHIDLYLDYAALIEECEQARIVTVAVTNTPSVFRRCKELLAGKKYMRAALGLHPELAHLRQSELALMMQLLPETRFIGEVGLDFVTQDAGIRDVQKKMFYAILNECARSGDKILTVHSRRAAKEIVEMVGSGYRSKVILHWYSGPMKTMEQALSYGFYFSVNTAMTVSEAGRKIIAAIPRDRLLTESDGPFVSSNGGPVRPCDVRTVISYVADLWGEEEQFVAQAVQNNFGALLTKQAGD